MADAALSAEAILDAAEGVIRRFGPAKATVLDVARSLGVSHGSVYRHFPSKVALRDAVAQRWLERVSQPLREIAAANAPAPARLRAWLEALSSTKQRMAREDPELFATFHRITTESREVVTAHLDLLAAQLSRIVADGVASGHYTVTDPHAAGRAVLHATARFHHPAHAIEWADPRLAGDFDAVASLVARGLAAA
ncbi:MAG TPA: TetR family transcriptional regulator [Candidatus Lustribacter sp.]|nr:TetR family transcriptional regulator [Candidatus Lustribacter sp.]